MSTVQCMPLESLPQWRFGIYTILAMGKVGRRERFGHEYELTYSCMDYERDYAV